MPDVSLIKSVMILSEEEFNQLKNYHLKGPLLKELFTLNCAWTSDQLLRSIRLAFSASTAQDLVSLVRSLRTSNLGVDEMNSLMNLSQGRTVVHDLLSDA